MRITWVTRSFLDYRIPVYQALNDLCGNKLTLIYNEDKVPERCSYAIKKILGERAIGLKGELRIATKRDMQDQMANKGFSFPYHKDLIKEVRKSEPEVIVSDGFMKWTYAALWIRKFNRKGIKHLMCYERTPHTERNAGKVRTFYRKFVSKWIDAIDCNGNLTAEYVSNDLNFKKPLTFGHMTAETDGIKERINNLDDLEIERLKSKYNLNGTTFLYLGQLIPRKGIMELLEAWVNANLLNASLLLVGEGHQRKQIEDFIKNNNLSNVIVCGKIDYDKLAPYYKLADVFIIPTLEDNWSLVVPEAMSAGLPIACSVYNGCHPELVRPKNGWTFDPLNLENTVETLKKIYDSRDKFKEMGRHSLKIIENHTPQIAAQNIFDMCNKLLTSQK